MQLVHDMLAICGVLNKYVEFSNSWRAQVEAESHVVGCDQFLKASKKQEAKLKELADLQTSSATTTWELEARVSEKEVFAKE